MPASEPESNSRIAPGIIPGRHIPWRDVGIVIGGTAIVTVLCVHYDLNEWLYALTRHVERFQLDELPIGAGALLVCLVWFAWRRYRDAAVELRARFIAESQLARLIAENRALAQQNLRIHEAERKHLARELHDELGQYLNAIKLDAVSITAANGTDAGLSLQASNAIIRAVDHVHVVVREMVARLRPVGLDELGLAAAIEHCVEQWRTRLPKTQIGLSMRGNFDDVGEDLSLTVYRAVQEALTNIYRHAEASVVSIVLERDAAQSDQELHLTVADNGRGISPRAGTLHFGLRGMRERIELAGGTFLLDGTPGSGVRIDIRVPRRVSHGER